MVILGNVAFGHMETEGGKRRLSAGQPDEEDAVTVMIDFKNDTGKTIQNAAFFFLPYDVSGNIAPCGMRGRAEARLKLAGTIGPRETRRRLYWESVWYSRTITRVRLTKVEIEYTDGSAETLTGSLIRFEDVQG